MRASGWIFLTRPLSTVPGPTSTYVVTPSDARRRTTSSHARGRDLPHQRLDRGRPVALQFGIHVRHDRHPRRLNVSAPAAPARDAPRPASSARSGTARSPTAASTRRAPSALARSPARCTAASMAGNRPPDRGQLMLAGLTISTLRRVVAGLAHDIESRAENRRHRPGADRHGFLHVASARGERGERRRRTRTCPRRRARSTHRGCDRRRTRAGRPRARARGTRRCWRSESPAA